MKKLIYLTVLGAFLIIDNLVYAQTEFKLTGSAAKADELFGWSVSISGDLAVVGAPEDEGGPGSGSAYVFKRTDLGWIEEAKLTASDAAAGELFGWSVSISGNLVMIGVPGDDDAGSFSGSAYTFKRTDTGWIEMAKLTASDAASTDNFGTSVSIQGGLAVVGAPLNDDAGFNSGAAYIFKHTGMGWIETAKLAASDAAAFDRFGNSASISNGLAIVGARDDTDAGRSSGSAYVFKQTDMGWIETAKLTASDAASGDFFGDSVSLSGALAIVGAPGDDDAGSGSGSAYVFKRFNTDWIEEAKLTASDAAAADAFGRSVYISGDLAVVGASGNDDAGANSNSGSAYVFKPVVTSWIETSKLIANDAAAGDSFGSSVSISGSVAVVGAPGDDNGGSAYVYEAVDVEDPLPVELVWFTTRVTGSGVMLEWLTATESNNYGFVVERKDVEENDWREISFVEGHGTSIRPHHYRYIDKEVESRVYRYRLKQIDFDGSFSYSDDVLFDLLPKEFELKQNYPNPFNPETRIRFQLPQESHVTLKIFNMLGQQIQTLADGAYPGGSHSIRWDGMDNQGNQAPSGIYLYKLRAGTFSQVRKMSLLR